MSMGALPIIHPLPSGLPLPGLCQWYILLRRQASQRTEVSGVRGRLLSTSGNGRLRQGTQGEAGLSVPSRRE